MQQGVSQRFSFYESADTALQESLHCIFLESSVMHADSHYTGPKWTVLIWFLSVPSFTSALQVQFDKGNKKESIRKYLGGCTWSCKELVVLLLLLWPTEVMTNRLPPVLKTILSNVHVCLDSQSGLKCVQLYLDAFNSPEIAESWHKLRRSEKKK